MNCRFIPPLAVFVFCVCVVSSGCRLFEPKNAISEEEAAASGDSVPVEKPRFSAKPGSADVVGDDEPRLYGEVTNSFDASLGPDIEPDLPSKRADLVDLMEGASRAVEIRKAISEGISPVSVLPFPKVFEQTVVDHKLSLARKD